MKVREVFELLEGIAPVKVSDELCAKYKMFDNSGIIIDMGGEVTGCLFSLDFSLLAVQRAKEEGYNLIITHHPAIYGGIHRIDSLQDGKGKAIAQCIAAGISVISMHLNFDAAPCGIDHYLMQGLGGSTPCALLNVVEGGAYGRVYDVQKTDVPSLMQRIAHTFCTQRAAFFGDKDKGISKIASFCGAGCDDESVAFAIANGADAFVSSDLKHHLIAELVERGIVVISLTHYCAEAYGFRRIYENIKSRLRAPSSYLFDDRLA